MGSYQIKELKENEYTKWDKFVDESPQGNIFNKSWWIKAVSRNFKVLVFEEGNQILGGIILPFDFKDFYKNPKLTPTLGIIFRDFSMLTQAKRQSKEIEIMNAIIRNLPNFYWFDYSFSYNFKYWLPFKWEKFDIDVTYTYVLEDLTDINKVYNGLRSNIKSDIKKAIKNGIVIQDSLSIEDFFIINKKSFSRQKIEIPYSDAFLKSLDKLLADKEQRKMLFAVDSQGKINAAAYIVYDDNTAYYLMGGGDPKLRNSGATSLLLWESIKFASTVSKHFDFEGSSVPSIEVFFRAFGGTPKPIFRIYKGSTTVRLLIELLKKQKNLLRKIGFFK